MSVILFVCLTVILLTFLRIFLHDSVTVSMMFDYVWLCLSVSVCLSLSLLLTQVFSLAQTELISDYLTERKPWCVLGICQIFHFHFLTKKKISFFSRAVKLWQIACDALGDFSANEAKDLL